MRVALTFDAEHPDRPGCAPGAAEGVIDLLADRGVRATFFMQGRWVQAYPETARRIVREGHAVGSHSHHHARMPMLSAEGLEADVAEAEEAIRSLAGIDPRPWFRCPWGLGWDDQDITAALGRMGYRHVGWDLLAYDWEPATTPAAIEEAVLAGVRAAANDEVTVLLHPWPEQTLLALPGLLARLAALDTDFIGVDDLRSVPRPGLYEEDRAMGARPAREANRSRLARAVRR